MKTTGLFLLLFLFTFDSFATVEGSKILSLRTIGHSGFQQYDVVEIRAAKEVVVNGLLVPTQRLAKLTSSLKEIQQPPQGTQKCSAGIFIYEIYGSKFRSRQKVEGCSRGPEYARVFAAFQALKAEAGSR